MSKAGVLVRRITERQDRRWKLARKGATVGNVIESTLLSLDEVMGDPTWSMTYHDEEAQADALELIAAQLLDEMRLRIHPLLVGEGQLLLRDGVRVDRERVHSEIQKTGVALLDYRRLDAARKRG